MLDSWGFPPPNLWSFCSPEKQRGLLAKCPWAYLEIPWVMILKSVWKMDDFVCVCVCVCVCGPRTARRMIYCEDEGICVLELRYPGINRCCLFDLLKVQKDRE